MTATDEVAPLDDLAAAAPPEKSWLDFAPWLLVAVAIGWGLWELRPELTAVPYLDDSSIHQQMVRFAATRLSQGHSPLTSWFPYLGLGSPQFLHYQSLPSMISGAFGTAFDPDTVFRWTMYLLLALWPLAVYWAARLFGLGRWTAAAAAAVSPLLASSPGIGYEDMAYIWRGYGVWTQLWASWTLPLAWAFSYRALDARRSVRRSVLPAAFFIMVTVALHFETGYLAFVPLVVWPFLVPSDLWRRVGRAVLVGGSALVASAWVIVPLLAQSHWAARNQVLEGTGLENGYGARHFLWMLITGRIFDADHWFPIITIFVGVGLLVCGLRWRTFLAGRALVTIFVVTLLMTFGRTTWHGLYGILPGSTDIFIRRFQMGVQLSGILIAGVGFVFVGRLLVDAAAKLLPADRRPRLVRPAGRALVAGIGTVGLLFVLTPAWTSMDTYNGGNSTNVNLQADADASLDPQIDSLLAYVQAHPRGRVYAGQPTNWGNNFTVGDVPVFKYLESRDIDEVGYTLRTASLMTDPEYYFDDTNPGDYPLFGIGYILTPSEGPSMEPPVPAQRVRCAGGYCLWALPDPGYIHVYDTTGVLTATRGDVGTQSESLLNSEMLTNERDDTVAFNGRKASPPTATQASALTGPPGHVVVEHANLAQGKASAVVRTDRRAAVVLSASYDPGWTATVDGHPAPTVMVAPAVVGVDVGPGVHTVTFAYGGYGYYTLLFALAGAAFVALLIGPFLWRLLWRHSRSTTTV
ncbi:MAG TPA: YfhO family protein [Acidimicrobiales bacterium]|nr:YfhO family protein [Acidimicrobiales bacterium]